jgi:DNA (cytosine-5)-methyltransferase 1
MDKWKPVREVLDLDDEGVSIFDRKKPLVDNTIKVILKGVIKALEEKENGILFNYYGNGDNLNSFNKPAGTVTTKDRFAKIHLIFNQYKNGNISSIENPLGTITTTPKANLVSFLMNPSYRGHTSSINKPSPVIIARQDKAPLYLIRAIMNEFEISDIKMRMLNIPELKQIQGFPKDYKLVGNQTEQKKYIGNAVEVNQAKALVQSNYYSLIAHFDKIAS